MVDFILDDLYHEIILDYSSNPRNYRKNESANTKCSMNNSICGDEITMYADLEVENGVINDICFQGYGCSIFMSSASIATELVKGKTIEEFNNMFDSFCKLVITGESDGEIDKYENMYVFSGVHEYPMRVKCATMPWHAIKKAISNIKVKN